MNLPQKFFSSCGCGSGNATPSSESECDAGMCDERFLALPVVDRLQIHGLPPGSFCPALLSTATIGFVWNDGTGTGATINNAPELNLPEVTGTFPHLMVGGAGTVAPWQFFGPTVGQEVGTFSLQCVNGLFQLVPSGVIDALNTVMTEPGYKPYIFPFGGWLNGSNEYEFHKLQLTDKRLLVGELQGSGLVGMVSLQDAVTLEHPLAAFEEIHLNDITFVDDDGDPVAGGILSLPHSTATVANSLRLMFNPTTKKFYQAPAHTYNRISSVADQLVTFLAGVYQPIPGHLNFGSLQVSYPNVEVTMTAQSNNTERLDWALYIDGGLVFEWLIAGTSSGSPAVTTLTTIVQGLTPGIHTFEFRVKTNSVDFTCDYSTATLKTLPV